MKSKIIIAFITAAIFSSYKSEAQLPHLSLYVHGLYASAIDKSSQKFYHGGIGAVAGLTLGSKNTRAVASVGYTNFFSKQGNNNLPDEVYIPAKLGVREYLPLTLHMLYLQGDLGVGFISNKNSANNVNRFAADIGAGVHLKALEAALIWDSFKESSPNGWSSWLTFQLGFNIGI